jgi:hypothetical protein
MAAAPLGAWRREGLSAGLLRPLDSLRGAQEPLEGSQFLPTRLHPGTDICARRDAQSVVHAAKGKMRPLNDKRGRAKKHLKRGLT